jgi:MFS family permease
MPPVTVTLAPATDSRPTSQRRLLGLLLLGNLTLYALYGGIAGILLPTQVENIDSAHKVANLGIVTGISAIFATAFNPIGGALSDRTRSRFGRRHPWILGAAIVVLVLLLPLGKAATIPLLVIFWCLAQGAANVYQAAITAVVPDRVPPERRGTASAVAGAAIPVGMVVGIVVAGRFTGAIPIGYLTLGALLLASALLFVTLTRDPPSPEADGVALMTAISSVGMMITTAIGGPLSDRLDRRKAFVFASSAIVGVAMLLPLLSPHWGTMIIFMAVNGAAFGIYLAVDTAMVTLVLPRQEDAARDMGVLNIATAGPQITAPFIASLVINYLGGYDTLFIASAVLAAAGALAILPVRSIR